MKINTEASDVMPSPELCRVFSSVAFKALLFWEMLLTTT
jgi:hypothetical protein